MIKASKIISIIIFVLFSLNLFAKSPYDEFNSEEKEKLWQINGYIQSENYMMVNPKIKKYLNEHFFNKIEQHGKIDIRIGTDTIHGRGVIHGFLYPTNEYSGGNENHLLINELYMQYLNNYMQIKAGRQVIQWGTADVINPTSYFAPSDFSEMLLKSEDEAFLGVDAFSLMFLVKNWSIQLVVVPVATFSRLPSTTSPWAIRAPAGLTYQNQTPDRSFNAENICYGARIAASISGVDFSFSGYHGLDREILLLPTPAFTLIPIYKNFTAFGFDFAYTIKDFTIQFETTYSFDKKGITSPIPGIKETHQLAYAAGINWQIDVDSNDFFIVAEFYNSHYLENADDFEDPFLFGLLMTKITKRFFNNSFLIELGAMFNVFNLDWMIIPAIGYDFLNGFILEARAFYMDGDDDTFFGNYKNRDIVSINAKYQF